MNKQEKEFSFDEFKKSELFKKCSESFYKQPENSKLDSDTFEEPVKKSL